MHTGSDYFEEWANIAISFMPLYEKRGLCHCSRPLASMYLLLIRMMKKIKHSEDSLLVSHKVAVL